MESTGVFDVDLRGLIDVLGTNLYTSPAVYIRELLQNAIDAQAVAGRIDAEVSIVTDGREFTITDSGVGMHDGQIAELLGTIGRSSKRDELGFSGGETIGQFGVGLLSGFLVGEAIEVNSKADGHPAASWTGEAAGRVQAGPGDRTATGTTVRIVARPGMERWLQPERVAELAAEYTALHPTPVTVNGVRVNPDRRLFDDDPGARAAAQVAYCQDEFGFTPLESFDLDIPQAGLRGIAYVRPSGGDLVARAGHRVYVKGLLVGDVPELVPEWAYFVRVLVCADGLTPTASRESVVRNDLFAEVHGAIGEQVVGWLTGLEQRPSLREKFLGVHEQGIKALAAHRRELLGFVDRHCLFETNSGAMPLATFRARFQTLRYTTSVDDFRVLGDVLSGRGMGLVNAGYAFEAAVIRALVADNPEVVSEYVTQDVLLSALGTVDEPTRERFAGAVSLAETALAPFGCDTTLTRIEPDTLSAILLTDDSARLAADRRDMLADVAGEPDAWLAALGAVDAAAPAPQVRPVLVLNTANALIGRLPEITDPTVAGALVRTVYSQALVRARRSLPAAAAAEVDSAISLLADLATRKDR
ncbi:HSP90 family protein [Gordonia sp. VNK21]|uniref:HSP90 family protein n=1 Tax=Gordonia sp. VNK21 TaxID=3382483 RepID=UPI0038D4B7ED